MRVATAVGHTIGTDTVFGVVGSGNFHVTNALIEAGARFVAARHEGGAATMADAWARVTGRTGVVTVHQGPGLTNAMTGITEAAKSRTPLLVLAAQAPDPRSNFHVDVAGLAAAVGATYVGLRSAATAVADTRRGLLAAARRRTVILGLPLDVLDDECDAPGPWTPASAHRPAPDPEAVRELAELLRGARRPVFIAGRGAREVPAVSGAGGSRAALLRAADGCGALLATSAVAKGLFRGDPRDLDVSGGFATPLAAERIRDADVIVAWGCSLNMWTTRHGRLLSPDAALVQVDDDPAAIGAPHPPPLSPYSVRLGITGDVALTARALAGVLGGCERVVKAEGATRWRDVPYDDDGDGERIDPRTLTIALDDILPAERTVVTDSGNFMGYPAMFLDVPDADGFVFTQAYQSIGLGLASAVGAAVARPDRLTVAALGDGGALMGIAELETVVRLGQRMVIVVYDDEAYGAEVHHFGPDGYPLSTVRFPPADIAEIGRGFGCEGVTVRSVADLDAVRVWDGSRPLLIDAKVTSSRGAWWLEEAFRGHALLAWLWNMAGDLGVHSDVVQRTGQDRDGDRARSGARVRRFAVIVALASGDGADDQPDQEYHSANSHGRSTAQQSGV
jgi:acetolactate synthase I/II/III large subunit